MEESILDNLEGYWYCENDILDSNFERDGMQIKSRTNQPPWLVVNKTLQSTILTGNNWPGELWSVRVLESGDMSNLVDNVSYWRANSILLLKRLPLSKLFGKHGEKVVSLILQIQSLSMEQVDVISSATNPCAAEAYSRAWETWNRSLEHPRTHHFGSSHSNALGMPHLQDNLMSPINYGFTLIHDLVRKKAQELEGDDAFTEEDYYGDIEIVLTAKWGNVASAFLCAAMAFGAPEHIGQKDYETLVGAWQSVFTIT